MITVENHLNRGMHETFDNNGASNTQPTNGEYANGPMDRKGPLEDQIKENLQVSSARAAS